jgi:DNA-binding response OmpR family regulator
MSQILVVDDDPTTLSILRVVLTDAGYTVTTVLSGTEALRLVRTIPFSLILLDVVMPGLGGFELCRQIRTTSQIPIIFISALNELPDKIAGFEAGGDDYLIKPFEPAEALVRIRAVMRRAQQSGTGELLLRTADMVLDTTNNQVTLLRNSRVVSLTPIETRLLRCLLSEPGAALTRDMLMTRVWGYPYQSTSNQLDVYMRRLRDKLEEHPSQPVLLLTVRGIGYKYQPGQSIMRVPGDMQV